MSVPSWLAPLAVGLAVARGRDPHQKIAETRPFYFTGLGVSQVSASGVLVSLRPPLMVTSAALLTPFLERPSMRLPAGCLVQVKLPYLDRRLFSAELVEIAKPAAVERIVGQMASSYRFGYVDDDFGAFALLRLVVPAAARAEFERLSLLRPASPQLLQIGDRVNCLSSPFGLMWEKMYSNSLSEGVVSNVLHDPETGEAACVISDCRSMPGSEGGALIFNDECLVGFALPPIFQQSNPIGFCLFASPRLVLLAFSSTLLRDVSVVEQLAPRHSGVAELCSRFACQIMCESSPGVGGLRGTGISLGSGVVLTAGHVLRGLDSTVVRDGDPDDGGDERVLGLDARGDDAPLVFVRFPQRPLRAPPEMHSFAPVTDGRQPLLLASARAEWAKHEPPSAAPRIGPLAPSSDDNAAPQWGPWLRARVLYLSARRHDLAVLLMEPPHTLLERPWPDDAPVFSAHALAGRSVLALGYPLGPDISVTVAHGSISRVAYDETSRAEPPRAVLLQLACPVLAGHSGGPLFNERGELEGIVLRRKSMGSWILEAFSFALPAAVLEPALRLPAAVVARDVPACRAALLALSASLRSVLLEKTLESWRDLNPQLERIRTLVSNVQQRQADPAPAQQPPPPTPPPQTTTTRSRALRRRAAAASQPSAEQPPPPPHSRL